MISYEVEPAHDGKSWLVMRREQTDPDYVTRTYVARYATFITANAIASILTGAVGQEVSQ